MSILFSIIIFLYIILLLLYNIKSSMFIEIIKYKIGNKSYINGVFYKKINRRVILHGYSTTKNINFYNCILLYTLVKFKCIAIINKLDRISRLEKSFFTITLITNRSIKPSFVILNNLKIKIPKQKTTKYKYVVCSTILFNYSSVNYLVQYFESLKFFGVSKVVTYYTSSTSSVITVLSYYVKNGLLDLYKYDDEMESIWKNIYYGQVGKLNHCFQQYQEVSNYIMEFDYDEVLWPNKGDSYDDIFNNIPINDVYYTHTRYFPISKEIYNKSDKMLTVNDIDMFNINLSSCQTYNGIDRKYIIANPMKVMLLEIHFIVMPKKLKISYLNSNIAYLRHTRRMQRRMKLSCSKYFPFNKTNLIKRIEKRIFLAKERIWKNE